MWARRVRIPCEAGWWPVSSLAGVTVLAAGCYTGTEEGPGPSSSEQMLWVRQISLLAILGHALGA